MSGKLAIVALLFIQVFSLRIPSKYFKSINSKNFSNNVNGKIMEKLLIFENEIENTNKTDNRANNKTDPKSDNRTDNRTDI